MSSTSVYANFDTESEASEPGRSGQPEYQINWLSRFLHIKPATKTLCFQVGRRRTRKALLSQLRKWERHGVQDVSPSPEDKNVINVRLDKNNCKWIALESLPSAFKYRKLTSICRLQNQASLSRHRTLHRL